MSSNNVDVHCKAGATTGTANLQVKATNPTPAGATLGSDRRIDVTWTGTPTTMNKFDKFFKVGGPFPCAGLSVFTFTLYNPADVATQTANVTFHRVGPPS